MTSSDDYARRFSGAVGRYFLEVQTDATLELLRPLAAASVLDVGGGHGQLTGALVEAGLDVTVLGSDPACERRVAPWTRGGTGALRRRRPAGARAAGALLRRRALVPPAASRPPLAGARRDALAARAAGGPRRLPDAPQRQRRPRSCSSASSAGSRRTRARSPCSTTRRSSARSPGTASGRPGAPAQFLFPMALHRATRSAGLARALEGARTRLRSHAPARLARDPEARAQRRERTAAAAAGILIRRDDRRARLRTRDEGRRAGRGRRPRVGARPLPPLGAEAAQARRDRGACWARPRGCAASTSAPTTGS